MTDAKKLSMSRGAVSLRLCVGSQPATAQANPTWAIWLKHVVPGRWDLTIKDSDPGAGVVDRVV